MERLDKFLFSKGYFSSRQKAQQAIEEGKVFVDGKLKNPSFNVLGNEKIEVLNDEEYVSRGAFKLLKAVDVFGLNLKDKVVLDVGASTGGFTQVCLKEGAKKVYALDVGKGQLHDKLKVSAKVVDLSETDFRTSKKYDDVDFIVSDVSFISLKHIIPEILQRYEFVPVVVLFKPQFECGMEFAKKKNGVVKDKKLHLKLLKDFLAYLKGFHIKISGIAYSPIAGKNGNIEYLFYLNGQKDFVEKIENIVDEAFKKL